MSFYILNSATITSPGLYAYVRIDPETAARWIKRNYHAIESAIGYQEIARALEILLGLKEGSIDVNRRQIQMKQGDEALIFRLTCRVKNPCEKGSLSTEFVLAHHELGVLKKLSDY